MTGTANIHANSSIKLTLKIVWLRTESVPVHLPIANSIESKPSTAIGAKKYIIKVGGIALVYLQTGAPK